MKTYQLYHGEFLQAENKLRHAENQRIKVEQQQNAGGVVGAKTAISRRFRNYDKLSEKVSWGNLVLVDNSLVSNVDGMRCEIKRLQNQSMWSLTL